MPTSRLTPFIPVGECQLMDYNIVYFEMKLCSVASECHILGYDTSWLSG